MRLYAASPSRRSRQVAVDLLVVIWVAGWTAIGLLVHRLLADLAQPIDATAAAADAYRTTMTNAAKNLADVPAVGSSLAKVFANAAQPGATINGAAVQTSGTIGQLALALGLLVAVGPILGAGIPWLRYRIGFVRAATATQRLVEAGASLDLFALRALSRQPVPVLARISSDPYNDWRNGNAQVVRDLAALEMATPPGLEQPG